MQKQVQNNARPVLWSYTFFTSMQLRKRCGKGFSIQKSLRLPILCSQKFPKKSFWFLEIVHTACLYYVQCTHIGFQKTAAYTMYVPSTYQLRMGKVLTVLTAPFLRALLYCISICHILQILFVLCLSQSDSDNNNEAQRNRTCMASSFWYMTKV